MNQSFNFLWQGSLSQTRTPDAFDGMLQKAIADARQTEDVDLQREALSWLWVCCPDVADELKLPSPRRMRLDHHIVEYAHRYAAF